MNKALSLSDKEENRLKKHSELFHKSMRSIYHDAIIEYLDNHGSDTPPVYIDGMPEWEYRIYMEDRERQDRKEEQQRLERERKDAEEKERAQIEMYRYTYKACGDLKGLEDFEKYLKERGGKLH